MNETNAIGTKAEGVLATLAAARLDADRVPTRVLIVPWGNVQSTSGGFVVDAEAVRLVAQAFQEHGADLPVDYEHQTLGGRYTAPSGQAPAAGWIKRIEAEEGVGVFAEVAWTEPALEQLTAKQYRYLSPVALIRKSDRKLVALHSVALTNKPAIVNMTPIVNREGEDGVPLLGESVPHPSGGRTDVHKRNAHPRPPEDWGTHHTGPDDDSTQTSSEAMAVLREHLALPPDCEDVEVLAAVGRRLAEVEQEATRREAHRRVTEAHRQGRLTEAQRDWALNLAQKDPALFDEWLKTAPVVVPLGRTESATEVDRSASRRKVSADAARAEFRSCPALASITSEEAYVASSVQEMN